MVVSNAAQQALHRTSTVKTSMTKSVEPEPLRRANTEKSSKKKDSLQVTNSINLHGSSDTVHQAISTDLSVASKRGTKSLMSEVNGYLRERSENPRLMKLKMQCQNGEGSQSHMPEIQLTDMERELPLIEPSGQKAPVPDSGHLKTPKARSRRESLSVMECESIDTNHITITRQAGNVEERLSPLLLAAKLANQVQSQKRSTPLARFRSYARSVLIFLQWFKYLGRNLKVRVEWDWAWDPRSYVEYNPFAKKDQSALTRDMHDFASSLKTVKYNGVMVDVVRNILRKEPRKRTSSELDSLTTFFSTMKAFEKYDLETRRLFVANGRYGRWDAGRHIIKERHPAESFYIVLEGQIEIWLLDKRFYDAKDTSVADYSKSLDDNFDPMHKVTIAKLGGGAAFGEVAFTQAKDKKRGACVSTLKETEFLYIENKDAKSILKVNTDKSLIEKTECIESIPLLKTLRIDAKTLAYYSTLKVVGVDTPIITEGEKSDFLYIIKSGSCRVLKTVKIQKKGKDVKILTSTMSGGFKQVMEQERLNNIQNPPQFHLIVLGELHEKDFFGQEIGRGTSGASIVTNKKCEIVMIPRDEVLRFATQETWTQVAASMQKVQLESALGEYEKHLKWAEARRSILLDSISENYVV